MLFLKVIPVTDGTQLKLPIKTNGISCDMRQNQNNVTIIAIQMTQLSPLPVLRILDAAINLSYTTEQ